jgi:hypothetical protein
VTTEILKSKLRNLLLATPNQNIFPQEPWSDEDLQDAARIVQDFVNLDQGVIDDSNPWKEWLDRWRFYEASRKGG